ncbi:AAA family ATPase [Sharpea azabuensis]|uniref:AAA family ATPase n=1 Tax=Sharpea azabuensis TaxID=322505 RepID=UPI001569460E|nr:AAA family ATPase [Sharpea azabuensis]
MTITLPTQKIPAVSSNPSYLIIYGLPKSGKTSCLAQLENNLIIDLEGGSKFVDALAIQARSINDLGEIASAIRAKNAEVGHNFYKHITIDNATRLEDICMSYACQLYRNTELGKNWKGTDVTTLARGAGYTYLRQAVKKVIDMFRELCDEFILVGHVKDSITEKDGQEVNAREIDLVGKLGRICCGLADAVGYCYRKDNETHISFVSGGDGTSMEARGRHIAGKDIVIATGNPDGSLTTYWDKIYLPE